MKEKKIKLSRTWQTITVKAQVMITMLYFRIAAPFLFNVTASQVLIFCGITQLVKLIFY
jgi:hypothetical protein